MAFHNRRYFCFDVGAPYGYDGAPPAGLEQVKVETPKFGNLPCTIDKNKTTVRDVYRQIKDTSQKKGIPPKNKQTEAWRWEVLESVSRQVTPFYSSARNFWKESATNNQQRPLLWMPFD